MSNIFIRRRIPLITPPRGFLNFSPRVDSNISDALYNLKQIAREMLLLEGHLGCGGRQCSDCIRKHVMTLQGLLYEASMLKDGHRYIKVITPLTNLSNYLEYMLSQKRMIDYCKIASAVRVLRKPLVKMTFGRCIDMPGFLSVGSDGTAIRQGLVRRKLETGRIIPLIKIAESRRSYYDDEDTAPTRHKRRKSKASKARKARKASKRRR